MSCVPEQVPSKKIPWNKARFTGPKPPLKPKQIWGIRTRLQIAKRTRDLKSPHKDIGIVDRWSGIP